jgi:hypothetical protein
VKALTYLGAGLVFAVVLAAGLAMSTWLIMLFVGMIHSVWSLVPALGFWQAGIVAVGLTLLRVPRALNKAYDRHKARKAEPDMFGLN